MIFRASILALLLAAAGPASAQTSAGGSFCERAAAELGMKPKGKPSDKTWEMRILNPAQRFLVGGSAAFSVLVKVSGTPEDVERISNGCNTTKKGLNCAIGGPATYTFQVKEQKIDMDTTSADRAEIESTGSLVTCKDL